MDLYLAVITQYEQAYQTFCKDLVGTSHKLIRVSNVSDIQGRRFVGYISLFTCKRMDFDKLTELINYININTVK